MTVKEFSPATYRIFARNYDFTHGNLVNDWLSMDLELKLNDVSTCVMSMRFEDFMDAWAPEPGTTHTWLTNKTSAPAQEVGTGILIWRNQDVKPIFHGPIVDFHRIKKSDYDDMVELTFESDETYLKRRLLFPDNVQNGWATPNYYDPVTRLWNPEWENLNTAFTTFDSAEIMWKLVNGNCGPGDVTGDRAISKIGADYQFRVYAIDYADTYDGVAIDSYTDKLCTLLDMCQTLCKQETANPYDESIFEVICVHDDASIGTNNEYISFRVRQPPRKENYVIFSWQQGNIVEFDFREHVPSANVMYVQGDGSDFTTRIWCAGNIDGAGRADVADSIAKYGWFEAYCQKSDFESGESLAEKLVVMEDFGHTQSQNKLYNITVSAKVKESAQQFLTPDYPYNWLPGLGNPGDFAFWLGDYVTVVLDENQSYNELVRQINISVDADGGEQVEITVGPPTIEYNTAQWYSTMGVMLGFKRDLNVLKGRR